MQPSLTLIDAASGALIEKHALPAQWAQVSTRHVDMDDSGRIWFACQYEGHRNDLPPLVGSFAQGRGYPLRRPAGRDDAAAGQLCRRHRRQPPRRACGRDLAEGWCLGDNRCQDRPGAARRDRA
jgi:hypothetical protein